MYQLILFLYMMFTGLTMLLASKSSLGLGFYFLSRACIFAYNTAILTRLKRLRLRDAILWLIAIPKVLLFYYEYRFMKTYFDNIPKQPEMEAENIPPNPIETGIKNLFYGKNVKKSSRNPGALSKSRSRNRR